jgi:hypothetical protein
MDITVSGGTSFNHRTDWPAQTGQAGNTRRPSTAPFGFPDTLERNMPPDDKHREPARTEPARHGGLRRIATPLSMAALALVLALASRSGDAKRRPPHDVPPVVVGEIRYEVPRMGSPLGDARHGGIVVARRADSGDLVWTRRVYTVTRDPHKEGDVQDVFIKALTLTPDSRHLLVVNERGERFELDLDGSGVRVVAP